MRTRTRVLPLLLCLLAPARALRAGELTGSLVFPDGKPAAGVTVRAVPAEEPHARMVREARRAPAPAPLASAVTGADGAFRIAVPDSAGSFALETSGAGTVPGPLEGAWEAAEKEDLRPVTVTKGERLAGRVVDAEGHPVEGAEVTLGGVGGTPPLDTVVTAADGTFAFAAAMKGGNVVSAAKDGFAAVRTRSVRAGPLPRPLVLGAGVPLAGSVKRADGKDPAPGALVRWESENGFTRWVETDGEGRFTLAHAPAGKGTLVADAGESGSALVSPLAIPRAEEKPLVVRLVLPAFLEGRVVDARSLRPVPRVKIALRGSDGVRLLRSGPDGRYRAAAAVPRVDLTADDPRYVKWEKELSALRPGETRTVDLALVPGATLAGRVVDEAGAPVVGASGTLLRSASDYESEPAFRTARDGTFRATRLSSGENLRLKVAHREFETASLGGLSLAVGGSRAGLAVVLERGATLAGLVHDADGGSIAGAEVWLRRDFSTRSGRAVYTVADSRAPETTGPDGRFVLRGVAPGAFVVAVSKRGWAGEEIPVKVGPDRTLAPIDVTLVPGCAIRGFVRGRSGAPLEGVRVMALRGSSSEPSAPDGAFAIESLKAGKRYDLMAATRMARAPQKSGVVAPADGVELVTSGNGTIRGRAVDEKTGGALADFEVAAQGEGPGGMYFVPTEPSRGRGYGAWRPVHSEDGSFTIDEIPAGTWTVSVRARGYQLARVAGVTVEEGAARDDVEVRVAAGVTLGGRVVDARSGRGVPDTSVFPVPAAGGLTGPRPSATTDADGKFTLEGLSPQRYRITAQHAEYADAAESVDLKEAGGTVELRLTSGGALEGLVVDEARQPVAGAEVALAPQGGRGWNPDQSASTDGSGRFRIAHLDAGRFQITAERHGRTSPAQNVVLAAGETKSDLVLTLGGGITIRGTLAGLPDALRENATVMGSGPEGWFAMTRAGVDGRFELASVPAGAISLQATASEGGAASRHASRQVVTSDAQPVLETELVFEAGFALSGRVTRGGRPVSDVMVWAGVAGGGGRGGSARTDDAGAYRIEGLTAGRYMVGAFDMNAGGMRRRDDVEVTGDLALDLELPAARISGSVVEAGSRRPLVDARVSASAEGLPTREARTDSNGRFSLPDLEAKAYTLAAQKPDYLVVRREAAASESGGEELVLELTRGEGIGVEAKDGIYGMPLRSVGVRVLDGARRQVFSGSLALDSEGRGEIPSLPPGVYTAVFSASGYAALSLPNVTVPSGTLPVAMTPGGAIEVHAGPKTLASGSARLRLLTATGAPYPMFAEDGVFAVADPIRRIDKVAPGSYTLVPVSGGGAQPFTVQEGQTTIVSLP